MMHRLVGTSVALASIAVCRGQNLHQFIAKMKWDAAKQGPIFALAGDRQMWSRADENDHSPIGLNDFGRKVVRIGRLSAIVSKKRLDFPDDISSNPYDSLTKNDKMVAFLSSLNSSQWHELTEKGISPRELSGTQKQLLEALIPHPFRCRQWLFDSKGGSITENDPVTASQEFLPTIRLQLFKVLGVDYAAYKDVATNQSLIEGTTSLTYQPTGTHVYRVEGGDDRAAQETFSGQWVDNSEKPSQLNYKNPTLAKSISLAGIKTLGDLLQQIGTTCGLEIHADPRIAGYSLDLLGDKADSSDLLRAAALAVGGTYRQVGPAYVLTSDILGEATRGMRIQANAALVQLAIQPKVVGGRSDIKSHHLLDQLDFLSTDAFQARSFFQTTHLSSSVDADLPWVDRSLLNGSMQVAVPTNPDPSIPIGTGQQTMRLDPDRVNKVHFNVSVGVRYILPNGTVVEDSRLDLNGNSTAFGSSDWKPLDLPIDIAKSSIPFFTGYRTQDPGAVKQFCEQAKNHGLKEVWIETDRPEVLDAAADSGLTVDWVVRPWAVTKGDSQDFDLNVLGQTGAQFNAIPQVRFDYQRNQTRFYTTSLSPWSSGLTDHWARITKVAANKRIHKVVLADPIPSGYEAPTSRDYEGIHTGINTFNGVEQRKSLFDFVPDVYSFGYGVTGRLACIRQLGFDPIDYPNQVRKLPFGRIPYFENLGGYEFPNPLSDESSAVALWTKFEKMRNDAAKQAISQLITSLSADGHAVWLQYVPFSTGYDRSALRFGPASAFSDPYSQDRSSIDGITVNPMTAEDANGNLTYVFPVQVDKPTLIDFGDVPVAKLGLYFSRMFKRLH